MKSAIETIKRYFNLLAGFFPQPLPRGMQEFESWASMIIKTYQLPDNDSFRWSLAVTVLHLPATTANKAPKYFANTIQKAMSNQVVSQVIQDFKLKQQAEAAKAAEEAAKASAEAPSDTQNVGV